MKNYGELYEILSDIMSEKHVLDMKNFIQHGSISTYSHCESVAKLSYDINRKLSLHSDLRTLLVGAMLHDFYLYDWHKGGGENTGLHGFRHAERACLNAEKYFFINDDIRHVIYCHMWPLNLKRLPLSREAWIVCIADKCVSIHETLLKRK